MLFQTVNLGEVFLTTSPTLCWLTRKALLASELCDAFLSVRPSRLDKMNSTLTGICDLYQCAISFALHKQGVIYINTGPDFLICHEKCWGGLQDNMDKGKLKDYRVNMIICTAQQCRSKLVEVSF